MQDYIRINLDLMLVKRKMSLTELAGRIGISVTNLSLLKTGKVKGIRFSTLAAICRELGCKAGDILEYAEGPDPNDLRQLHRGDADA